MKNIIGFHPVNLSRIIIVFALCGFTSCDSLLEVDPPVSKIDKDNVFNDDLTATTAITGIYASMLIQANFASGAPPSITNIAGLSADELANLSLDNTLAIQFFENNILSTNPQVLNLWTSMYQIIYQTNSILEGLDHSNGLSSSVKGQLRGEALFVRAFCHFYLVNLFGDIPIIKTTSYEDNTSEPRVDVSLVYDQILSDLIDAKALIGSNYPSADRVRPNKAAVLAMLSRVYLYLDKWEDAEKEATEIILNPEYAIEESLDNVFLATSREAIWQLRPTSKTANTWEGYFFIPLGTPNNSYLSPNLVSAFEANDLRLSSWIGSRTSGSNTYYYPFKYKIRRGGPGSPTPVPLTEYSMVLRLAEQILIRAEARVKLGDIVGSIADIDTIRSRAGLPKISEINPGIAADSLIRLIEHERRLELFSEWGHRWFDLKRTDRATTVFGATKPGFLPTDELYPIPSSEFLKNRHLGDQNLGY